MSITNVKIIIIDNGTGITKSGFAGDENPQSIIPTLIGFKKKDDQNEKLKKFYVGEEAFKHWTNLDVKFPIEHGIIEGWNCMEQIWDSIFQSLKVDPSQHPVYMTEKPLTPKHNRVKMLK